MMGPKRAQQTKRKVANQNERSKKPKGRPANMHIARHQFGIYKGQSPPKKSKEKTQQPNNVPKSQIRKKNKDKRGK